MGVGCHSGMFGVFSSSLVISGVRCVFGMSSGDVMVYAWAYSSAVFLMMFARSGLARFIVSLGRMQMEFVLMLYVK